MTTAPAEGHGPASFPPVLKRTTGIGSLPHHNADAALDFSFRHGIPFLPQIPIRNPWEYMIAQALEGLPGLQIDADGSVTLNTDVWISRAASFSERLADAFATLAGPQDASGMPDSRLERFEPGASISSCWQPFVWELEERHIRLAKIQIAGPMTAQWALKLVESGDGQARPVQAAAFIEKNPELSTQIFRLVLARALAMGKRLQRAGVQPLLYVDEPGLYAYSPQNPRHVLALQELKLVIQALRKEGVLVGLHCCSDTDWATVLGLPLHVLSLDTALSLESLLQSAATGGGDELERFVEQGGRLSLGVIPTGRSSLLHSLDATELYAGLVGELRSKLAGRAGGTELAARILREAIYTPACGLALQSTADAELILEALTQFETAARSHPLEGGHGSDR
jgi:hypothetical protein